MNDFKRELLKEKAHAHYEYGYHHLEEKEAYFKLLDRLCDPNVMIISKSKLKEKLRVKEKPYILNSGMISVLVSLSMEMLKTLDGFIITPMAEEFALDEIKKEFIEKFEQEFDPNEGEEK